MQVEVQMAVTDAAQRDVPNAAQMQEWMSAALQQAGKKTTAQITVRIVEQNEIIQLNEQYRQKSGPTNVLSFPFEAMPGVPAELQTSELGDVVVCAAVVKREAAEQGKSLVAHWAHMIVHGSLHLLGYDHLQDDEAEAMESLEIAVLAELGYANPYS